MEKIINFLNTIHSVVKRSYQIEFAGVDKVTLRGQAPDLFGEIDSPIVLKRAALFTEAKDAYDLMSNNEKKMVDFYVSKMVQGVTNFVDFINKKVGGEHGEGACLQDATFSLMKLHNNLVEVLEITECEAIPNDIIDICRRMPPITAVSMESNSHAGKGEEKASELFKPLQEKNTCKSDRKPPSCCTIS